MQEIKKKNKGSKVENLRNPEPQSVQTFLIKKSVIEMGVDITKEY